jgi:hypothetical protein
MRMRRDRLKAAGVGLLVAGALAAAAHAQQPAQQPPAQPQAAPQPPDRPADSDRLNIFIVSAAIGISESGGRGRTSNRPCEITSVVRAFCSAPGGVSRDGCEITDGQIGARDGNLFVEPYRTDILQSCGISSLAGVTGFGVTYICRGAWSSQTVGQVTRHERPTAFGPDNQSRQSPPWRMILLCR